MDLNIAQQLLLSLALGMLVGLQRERTETVIGGIRTFPLITLFGTICGHLAQSHGAWVLGAGLISLTGLAILSNVPRLHDEEVSGLTTEIAVLLLFALGAWIVTGPIMLVVAVGGVVALLLHLKAPLHQFANAIGHGDMRAIMQFVLITMVILPVLPNREFGPFGVLNPFEIWLMVVLIVGMSLVGYVAYKRFGSRNGVLLSGLLGGMISSTATTVSAARHTEHSSDGARLMSVLIMTASAVSLVRVLIEIGAVASAHFQRLALPIGAMLAAMTVIAAVAYAVNGRDQASLEQQQNPAQLKTGLIFAVMYAGMKIAVEAGKEYYGTYGLYIVGCISGLTDMDAITLSTSRLVEAGRLDPDIGWRTILIAIMSNLVFKAAAVGILGSRRLLKYVCVVFLQSLVAGGLILWLWP